LSFVQDVLKSRRTQLRSLETLLSFELLAAFLNLGYTIHHLVMLADRVECSVYVTYFIWACPILSQYMYDKRISITRDISHWCV